MIINTNVSSITAQEAATNTGKNISASLEKLSTGLKINKASDDASGLAIADKLRTQGTSIDQGVSNGNSAVKLLQIADKSMAEQSNILDTVKAKLIQANTDTTSDAGRESIRKDISKLLEQLDNIAEQTNYNGNVLLQDSATSQNGSADLGFQIGESNLDTISNTAIQSNTQGLGLAEAQVSELTITAANEATYNVKVGDTAVSFTSDADATVEEVYAGIKAAIEADATANAAVTVQSQSSATDATMKLTSNTNNIAVNISTADQTVANATAATVTNTAGVNGVAQTGTFAFNVFAGADGDTASISIGGTEYEVNAASLDAGGVAIGDTATAAKVTEALKVIIDAANTGFTLDIATTSGSVALTADPIVANVALIGETNVDGSTSAAITASGVVAGVAAVTEDNETTIGTPVAGSEYELTAGAVKLSVSVEAGDTATDVAAALVKAFNDDATLSATDTASNVAGVFTVTANTGGAAGTTNDFTLQAFAADTNLVNATQTEAGTGKSLADLKDLATLTKADAASFQAVIDDAITDLNGYRGDIGSTQNQVESAVRNLMTQSTNVKAAESIIRDVDYAAESANFNKQNIISQAGSYAISQANSVQQNVLRLLQ
jgi:flagellin